MPEHEIEDPISDFVNLINDPIFQKHKSRLLKNMEHFNTKLIQN